MWGGGPAGAAVSLQQLLPWAPRGRAGGWPRGAGSGWRALWPGASRPDTAHPITRPRLPPRCQRAPGEGAPRLRGQDAPGPGVPPAGEEAPSGPAPDLSPSLTPEPAAAAARAAYGYPCGWTRAAGAAGTRARAEGPDDPEEQRRRGAERCRAGERDGVAGYLRSGTGSLSEPKSVLSLNNTRWPTRRHARHVTARSLRPAPCSAPPRPAPPPSRLLQPPTTSSFPLPPAPLPGHAAARAPDVGPEGAGRSGAGRRRRRSGRLPPALEVRGGGVQGWTRPGALRLTVLRARA